MKNYTKRELIKELSEGEADNMVVVYNKEKDLIHKIKKVEIFDNNITVIIIEDK